MKIGHRNFATLILIISAVISLLSCEQKRNYRHYYYGSERNRNQLEFLFNTLEKQNSPESRYIINLEIGKILTSESKVAALNSFLLEQVNYFPNDPFNSYYLNIVANYYLKSKAPRMAEIFYKRIIRNHPRITAKGTSIELLALQHLTQICITPEEKTGYGNLLLEKYPESVSPASIHLLLAQNYEKLGEWENSFKEWKLFQKAPFAGMQGEENLRKEADSLIKYYEYQNKDWTYSNLDDLVKSIRWAIARKNNDAIKRNMAKVNFFAVTWSQEQAEARDDFLSSLGTFMRHRIRFNNKLDINSNDQEAYWETNKWSYRIPTWYLYFRRIDFPADPSIHGKWEWAGIYFGEKPFKSAD